MSNLSSRVLLTLGLLLPAACGDDGGSTDSSGSSTSDASTSGASTSADATASADGSETSGSASAGDGDGDATGDGDGDATGDGDGDATGDGDGDGSGDGDGDSTGDGDGDGDGDTTGDGDGDSAGDGDGDADSDTGLQVPVPCEKVDILFVIDHSGSMGDEQSALLAAFPTFANQMIATLDTVTSLHVGVAASGPFSGNSPGSCAVNGALVAQPSCLPFAEGNRFITEADDIVSAFQCNAALGTGGPGDNNTMFNVVSSISDMTGTGECNEGFMREDALLVIIIITDEEDDHDNPPGFGYPGSPGDPADWIADVIAAKNDIATNVVVASFVQPPEPNACPAGNNGSFQVWYEANRIIEFTNGFSNSLVHDICDTAGYSDGFDAALAYIDTACEDFLLPE